MWAAIVLTHHTVGGSSFIAVDGTKVRLEEMYCSACWLMYDTRSYHIRLQQSSLGLVSFVEESGVVRYR